MMYVEDLSPLCVYANEIAVIRFPETSCSIWSSFIERGVTRRCGDTSATKNNGTLAPRQEDTDSLLRCLQTTRQLAL